MNTFELNNIRKDTEIVNSQLTKHSPVVEVFSAMVNGESLDRFGKKADKAVNYIKNLGARANNGDFNAITELNTIRRYVLETPILEEMQLLGIFGSYEALGWDESIEREIYRHVGDMSREQAANGDVVFPAIVAERYTVPSINISGGYEVDYRRVELGDMSKENQGMANVRTDMLNRAKAYVFNKVVNAIENATGIHYNFSGAGLTKTGVDGVLGAVRRFGRPTVVGDYAMLAQFTPWAGYLGNINSTAIANISEKTMNDIANTGLPQVYNGAILAEMPNPYNLVDKTGTWTDGTLTNANFNTMLPRGIAFVLPAGGDSPIATWTRGGLTSMTGNDVKTGKIVTRFDIEVAADVAKDQEYKIGILHDTNLD